MKKDKKYVELIRAFQSATYAKVISLEPKENGIVIYYKEPNKSINGWKYGTLFLSTK